MAFPRASPFATLRRIQMELNVQCTASQDNVLRLAFVQIEAMVNI